MYITLKFRTEDNQTYKITQELTVKQAREWVRDNKDEKKIVEAWGIWFDGWHDQRKQIWEKSK